MYRARDVMVWYVETDTHHRWRDRQERERDVVGIDVLQLFPGRRYLTLFFMFSRALISSSIVGLVLGGCCFLSFLRSRESQPCSAFFREVSCAV